MIPPGRGQKAPWAVRTRIGLVASKLLTVAIVVEGCRTIALKWDLASDLVGFLLLIGPLNMSHRDSDERSIKICLWTSGKLPNSMRI